jgi:hypothetical protein
MGSWSTNKRQWHKGLKYKGKRERNYGTHIENAFAACEQGDKYGGYVLRNNS